MNVVEHDFCNVFQRILTYKGIGKPKEYNRWAETEIRWKYYNIFEYSSPEVRLEF